ncbi:MAG TPA: hypothetical protein VFE79_04585, partial [Paraburkholderia sp.]|nr:hypothetical protein [Paraburkholderia sp.]
ELFECVSCNKKRFDGPMYFSPAKGGIVCRDCEGYIHDRIELDTRLASVLQMILRLPRTNGVVQRLPQLTRHQTDPINRLLAMHVEHTLGKRLRMPRWVVGR